MNKKNTIQFFVILILFLLVFVARSSAAKSLSAEILKVAHHGDKYSSTASFLTSVQPAEAIKSVENNPYGHPIVETLSRLFDTGAREWRTDELGTIVVMSAGGTYCVNGLLLSIDFLFLPLVLRDMSTPPSALTPTPTVSSIAPPPVLTSTPTQTSAPSITYTPTQTELPTNTPTPTESQTPSNTGNLIIRTIYYDGQVPYVESDEYAEIKNIGSWAVNVSGWRLNAGDPGQNFYFPSFVFQPGQTCRVYTNEIHLDTCGFSFGSGSALWINSGDCGYLYGADGGLVHVLCY
jgi:hypothetical protein